MIEINKEKYNIDDLLEIMKELRSPNGCPWDREQDHHSIRNDFIEETYEAIDAIDRDDATDMCEELGDVLLQVVFHSQIEAEKKSFDFTDVCDGICKKLIERHPHVFGSVNVNNSDEVLDNWDKIKQKSKNQTTYTDTLKSVPMAFPALLRAEKVQKRAKKRVLIGTMRRMPPKKSMKSLPNLRKRLETVIRSKCLKNTVICSFPW